MGNYCTQKMDIRKFLNKKPTNQSNLDENVEGLREVSDATDERHNLHVPGERSTNGPSGERSIGRVADPVSADSEYTIPEAIPKPLQRI